MGQLWKSCCSYRMWPTKLQYPNNNEQCMGSLRKAHKAANLAMVPIPSRCPVKKTAVFTLKKRIKLSHEFYISHFHEILHHITSSGNSQWPGGPVHFICQLQKWCPRHGNPRKSPKNTNLKVPEWKSLCFVVLIYWKHLILIYSSDVRNIFLLQMSVLAIASKHFKNRGVGIHFFLFAWLLWREIPL